VIVFDPARAAELGYRRKRAGHLFSKMRFLSAQLEAYLADDLWLANARHANAAARRLADGLAGISGARLRHPVEANEIFVELAEPQVIKVGQTITTPHLQIKLRTENRAAQGERACHDQLEHVLQLFLRQLDGLGPLA
jgi:threonine aldolase